MSKNCEADKSVMAALRSGRSNMGMRGHDCANYPFLFEDEGMLFLVIDIEMTVSYACDIKCVSVCEFMGRNYFKRRGGGGRM